LITAGAPLAQFDDLGSLPLHVAASTEERPPAGMWSLFC
jgi:hypothetical protein